MWSWGRRVQPSKRRGCDRGCTNFDRSLRLPTSSLAPCYSPVLSDESTWGKSPYPGRRKDPDGLGILVRIFIIPAHFHAQHTHGSTVPIEEKPEKSTFLLKREKKPGKRASLWSLVRIFIRKPVFNPPRPLDPGPSFLRSGCKLGSHHCPHSPPLTKESPLHFFCLCPGSSSQVKILIFKSLSS